MIISPQNRALFDAIQRNAGPLALPWEAGQMLGEAGLPLGLPQLDLAAGGTFTRASQGGYHVATLADYAFAANDVRRFENRNDTHLGQLLLEKSATNQCLRSEELSSVAWTKVNATVVADAIAAPDGVSDADALVCTVGGLSTTCSQTIAAISTGTATFSAWVRKRTSAQQVRITLTDGTSSTSLDITPTLDWTRYSVTLTGITGAVSAVLNVGTASAPAGSDDVYYWGAQVETGRYPSAYIVTAGAAATRAADLLTYAAGSYSERILVARTLWRVWPNFASAEHVNGEPYTVFGLNNTQNWVNLIGGGGAGMTVQLYANNVFLVNHAITMATRYMALSITVDPALGEVIIAGATTGNATVSVAPWAFPSGQTLNVGKRGDLGGQGWAGRFATPVSA